MNAQLRKEFRTLALPAFLTVVCALVAVARTFVRYNSNNLTNDFKEFVFGFAEFGFFAGVIFLAAMSFGSEFQQRTFTLLLSQPTERFRIWRDKTLVLAGIVATVFTFHFLTAKQAILSEGFQFHDATLAISFIVVIVCSTGLWTLLASSTIGGIAFSITTTLFGGGIIQGVSETYFWPVGNTPSETSSHREIFIAATIAMSALLYSVICMWAGWRKFASMELQDSNASDGVSLPKFFPGANWLGNLLRCQPTGNLRNLVRKELRLQKTAFIIALGFVACWILGVVLLWILPARKVSPSG